MNRSLFLETIKVKDDNFYNLSLHQERLQKTARHFFKTLPILNLTTQMIPEDLRTGLVKCRVLYNSDIVSIEFEPYSFKEINRLKVVEDNFIEYAYKSADRDALNRLVVQKGNADDIIIVKDRLITDTSYANLVFADSTGFYTPENCLLEGTKRRQLLDKGIIQAKSISLDDIASFSKIYLINAMIDLEDEICLPISNILP